MQHVVFEQGFVVGYYTGGGVIEVLAFRKQRQRSKITYIK
jgi:hypothetical protein